MIAYHISLSLLIVAVLVLRGIFKKTVSPRAIYALWLVVVVRMLLPVTLFSVDVTLPEFLQSEESATLPEDSAANDVTIELPAAPPVQTPPSVPVVPPVTLPVSPTLPEAPILPAEPSPAEPALPDQPAEPAPEPIDWKRIADLVWLIGAGIAAGWVLFVRISYTGALYRDRRYHRSIHKTKVYISQSAGVPCITGLIPSIYITPEAAGSPSETLIIIHEYTHLRHGDHIWAFFRALALIVFWWNPLVWAAAILSGRDAELACDDAVAAKLTEENRFRYARILLDTIPQKQRHTVGLGSAPMKERILMLTKRQKNRLVCLILAALLAVGAAGCSFIGSRKITMDDIFEQDGFTILSQKTVDIPLALPMDQLPSYDTLASAGGAQIALPDIPVFTTESTEIFLHTVGVSGHEPEGADTDVLYLGFDIRQNLADSGTVCTVHRVIHENGGRVYSPEVSVTDETLDKYDRAIRLMGGGPSDQFYLYIDASLYTSLSGDTQVGVTLNELSYARGSEVKTYGSWREEAEREESGTSDTLKIAEITLTPVDSLPYGDSDARFCVSPVGSDPTFLVFDDGLTFYLRRYFALDPEESCYRCTLMLPDGFTDGSLVLVTRGGGSGEVELFVKAAKNGRDVYLRYSFFAAGYDDFIEPAQTAAVLSDTEAAQLIERIASAKPRTVPQGPLAGYVSDKDTPWIRLYTEKDGIYVGRIPYEIFHDWVATDREREGWVPGWQPDYVRFYYAEFGDFRWAAAHLSDTVLGSGRKNVATSSDGGKTWEVGSTTDDYGGNHVIGMLFVSDKVAFMSFDPNNAREALDGPEISRTTDGGKTWERLEIPVSQPLKGKKLLAGTPTHEGSVIRYPIWQNPGHGSIEGDTMYIVSHDSGMTWQWEEPAAGNDSKITLAAYKNADPGDSLVFEGYTVEYECESPYGGTFDFHIHLPQLGNSAPNAKKWNDIHKEYEAEFGELLRKTARGTNSANYAHITYDTVTTGDVLTIYIVKSHGIIGSGAAALDYDIYHYNMKTDRFLSTDEFLAYYAKGQFAGYTVADIVKFMNEHCFTTDEVGNPYPLTEKNIQGVIPSVFGDGKFDVIYRGFSIEGSIATRLLLSPYPTHTSDAVYTYRLTYHDYVDCEDKKTYGTPAGYRLLLSQSAAGQFSMGYYLDCLFTEDIAEKPDGYVGDHYVPMQTNSVGDMYMVVDHETDRGHLNVWIPFEYPETAQDYYRGVHDQYFNYNRILDGNYLVKQDIAAKAAAVLDAYRSGRDPNALLPGSATAYTPYPLDAVRANPTADEIGGILRTASVGKDGFIDFSLDLGEGWRMRLPIGIGGFGDSWQAYFSGVYIDRDGMTPSVRRTLPHQEIMADLSELYDASSKQSMLLSDFLKTNGMTVLKYAVLDLDRDAKLETVLSLSKGGNESAGCLVLHGDDGAAAAHLLYIRQFHELKADGTFNFSGSVSNHGFGELRFDDDSASIQRIVYSVSIDNRTITYHSEADGKTLTKTEFDRFIASQDQKAGAAWYDWPTAPLYEDAQASYLLWHEGKITIDALLKISAVRLDMAAQIKKVCGVDPLAHGFVVECLDEGDRYPLLFYFSDESGKKMIEAGIIKAVDPADGVAKFSMEIDPRIILVE